MNFLVFSTLLHMHQCLGRLRRVNLHHISLTSVQSLVISLSHIAMQNQRHGRLSNIKFLMKVRWFAEVPPYTQTDSLVVKTSKCQIIRKSLRLAVDFILFGYFILDFNPGDIKKVEKCLAYQQTSQVCGRGVGFKCWHYICDRHLNSVQDLACISNFHKRVKSLIMLKAALFNKMLRQALKCVPPMCHKV